MIWYPAGGGGGGSWGGDKELQETPDTIFITNLNLATTEEDLMAHFGSIGIIKVSIVTGVLMVTTSLQ